MMRSAVLENERVPARRKETAVEITLAPRESVQLRCRRQPGERQIRQVRSNFHAP